MVETMLWRGKFLRIFHQLYRERAATLPHVNIFLAGGLAFRGYTTHDVDIVFTKKGFIPQDDTWDSEYNRNGLFGGWAGFKKMFDFIDELGHRCGGKRIDVFPERFVGAAYNQDWSSPLIWLVNENGSVYPEGAR